MALALTPPHTPPPTQTLTSVSDCDDPAFPKDPAFLAVRQFAKDEKAWLQAFMEAWWIGTTNAQGGLNFLTPPRSVPKNAGSCQRQHQKASSALTLTNPNPNQP